MPAAATSCATTTTTRTSSWPPTRARRRSPTSPTRSPPSTASGSGDAFASGGSSGYDHKKMGITARGAWESVKRHFRELGRDIQSRGLHRRRHRRHVGRRVRQRDAAVAAHPPGRRVRPPRRLPRPGPRSRASASQERKRLFELPRSSWADYDDDADLRRAAASSRAPPSRSRCRRRCARRSTSRQRRADADRADPRAAAGAGRPALERRHRHLREGVAPRRTPTSATRPTTPCASTPTSCAAASSARAATSASPSARRIEYALAGGRINTDAIDNSAGVDCSDHEVNIKILLDAVVADGDLTVKQRNAAARRR